MTVKTAQHTPGPWHARSLPDDTWCVDFRLNSAGTTVTGNIALIDGVRGPQGQANARLIAAAPTGHTLAEHLLAMADDAYLQGHPEWQALINEAKAYHLKATGGQS